MNGVLDDDTDEKWEMLCKENDLLLDLHELTGASYVVLRTCRLDLTGTMTTDQGEVRFWECSRCGGTCEEMNGRYERCPRCGAEVVQATGEKSRVGGLRTASNDRKAIKAQAFELLSRGHSPYAVALHMGIPLRTVRRWASEADVMEVER